MANFVLVHGAWHGGWCWDRVVPLLRARGHEVWAPTLTGLADKASLLDAETNLESHIDDVVALLRDEPIEHAILVGHSYGGMVISGVADRVPERLSRVVFLDAFVPEDGQSMFDILRPERRDYYRERAQSEGDGWRVPPPPPEVLGVTDPADASWLAEKMTFQPLRAMEGPVRLTGAAVAIPRSYVFCTDGPLTASFAHFAAHARVSPDWSYDEIDTGHDAMITAPDRLAAMLLAFAQRTEVNG